MIVRHEAVLQAAYSVVIGKVEQRFMVRTMCMGEAMYEDHYTANLNAATCYARNEMRRLFAKGVWLVTVENRVTGRRNTYEEKTDAQSLLTPPSDTPYKRTRIGEVI